MSQAMPPPIIPKSKKCGVCKERLSKKKLIREGYFVTGQNIPFEIMCWNCTVSAVRQLDDMEDDA